MSSSILRYGQVIRIRSHEHPNTFITSKSYILLYLSYTDQNVYFQVYNSNEQIATGVK